MHSFQEIIDRAVEQHRSLADVIVDADAYESGVDRDHLWAAMDVRLGVLRETADMAMTGDWHPKITTVDAPKYDTFVGEPLCGPLIWRASQIAMALGTCNASMGRIVAAPTAGSCGILPGMLFAWEASPHGDRARTLSGLVVAGGVGSVVASRATLAGSEGGCQAECGAAAAMGAAALCHLEGGRPEACGHAAALALKSITGLACDPVAGLVEVPCIKRNGLLVALGITAASMALAGIESVIPVDEMIDVMGDVGRALPPSLRETARGGAAISPTGRAITASLLSHRQPAGR